MSNLTYHDQSIKLEAREAKNGHKATVLWFTGLSASGKSVIAMACQEELFKRDYQVTVLDGDNVRHGLNAGLGFSDEDRNENLRRVSEAAKLFAESGMIVLTSFISPFRKNRDYAQSIIAPLNFFKVYIKVNLETAEARDPKGLYKMARDGKIKDFTGIDSPYEEPLSADLIIENDSQSIQTGVDQIINFLVEQQIIPKV
jgi:adenylylsulfate kinase